MANKMLGPPRQSLSRMVSASSTGKFKEAANVRSKRAGKAAVRSPVNKAILQSDPLFHFYLICVGLITLSILAIKCLIPGMPIYCHTVIGFAFLLLIILVSTIYTQMKSKKVSLISVIDEISSAFYFVFM